MTPEASENDHPSSLHLLKLDIRAPRLRRVRGGRVLVNHPVNEEFEEQLSKPFYFRQHKHGTVADVVFPKGESAEVIALKKGKDCVIPSLIVFVSNPTDLFAFFFFLLDK